MWLKITHYTKNKENHNSGEKRQSTNASTEMNQRLGLSDKDFKGTVIKMLQSQSLLKKNKGIEKSQPRNRSYKRK